MDTTSEVWSGLDEALQELGMLCGEEKRRGRTRETLEKARTPQLNELTPVTNCHPLRLLPSQSWSIPCITADEGDSIVGNNLGNKINPGVENSDNTHSVEGRKLVKVPNPKDCSSFCDSEMHTLCHSENLAQYDELNVLRMNSRYVTGVSIGKYSSSSLLPSRNESYPRSSNVHSNPKQGSSLPSLRHHHLRPYEIPWRREERVRTTSENGENESEIKISGIQGSSIGYFGIDSGLVVNSDGFSCGSLRKSRSLETVRIVSDDITQIPSNVMDTMSNKIQHLHVDD